MELNLEYETMELSNGIIVAHRYVDCPDVALVCRVNEGSIHEPEDRRGILHLIEHLLFKLPSGESIAERVHKITKRDDLHAFTGSEEIIAHFRMPSAALPELAELWSNCLTNNEYELEGFAREKGVVLNEITPMEIPGTLINYLVGIHEKNIYPDSILGKFIGGNSDTVGRLTPEIVEKYKRERINASNIVITIVGGYSNLRLAMESAFGRIHTGSSRPVFIGEIPDIAPFDEARAFEGEDSNTLAITFRMPGAMDSDRIGMKVLLDYLGGGACSRLFTEIRENRGFAYSAGVSYQESAINHNKGTIYVSKFDEANLGLIRQIIFDEIEKLRQGDVDLELLEDMTSGKIACFYEEHLETIMLQAARIDQKVGKGINYTVEQELEIWRNMSAGYISELAQRIFNEKYVIVLTKPKK